MQKKPSHSRRDIRYRAQKNKQLLEFLKNKSIFKRQKANTKQLDEHKNQERGVFDEERLDQNFGMRSSKRLISQLKDIKNIKPILQSIKDVPSAY